MSPELRGAAWRKSTRSGQSGGSCVEVARIEGVGAVRDSKNVTGPVLAFDQGHLSMFLVDVKAGRFDR